MPVSEHVIKSSLKAIEEPASAHSVAPAPVVGEPSTSIAPIPQNDSRLISRRGSTAHGRLSTDSEGHHRSIFTHGEKWFIVAICGFAGTFRLVVVFIFCANTALGVELTDLNRSILHVH